MPSVLWLCSGQLEGALWSLPPCHGTENAPHVLTVPLCPSLQLPGITQGLFAAPLAVLDKCCLCCPGTPELPRTCWLRTLLLLCTHVRLGSLICCPTVLGASPLPCLVAFPSSWLSAGLNEFLPQTVLTFIYRAICILLFPAHTSELSPAFIFPLWGSLLPSVQHRPQGCILAALPQLISKHFSVSLPVSEVWTT